MISRNVSTLIDAAQQGLFQLIDVFFTAMQKEIETLDLDGISLAVTAELGEMEALAYLLEQKAKVNARDSLGDTPLMIASRNGHKDCVSLLLERKADFSIKNNEGMTAIEQARQKQHKPVVKVLREAMKQYSLSRPTFAFFPAKEEDVDVTVEEMAKSAFGMKRK